VIEGNVFTDNQINQLKYVPRLTKDGFGKRRLTDKIFSVITDYYKDNKEEFVDEDGGLDKNGIINAWDETEPGSYIAPHKDFTIWCLENLKVFHEDWCGFELFPCMGYGPRKYVEGAYLQAHADRPYTHIISSIINIDQDVESKWPLQIYGYDNKLHNVFLEPGDILYYEGAKLLHGRTQPLNGKYFVNLFLHYRPIEWFLPQENVGGFLKQKKLHEDKTTESDWIEFYEKNTSERICGKKFPEVWLNDRWSNEYNNE
tara:strand:- start:150 stop:923 length:774 start_codon:yes stop_codon:yes gene_type:complete